MAQAARDQNFVPTLLGVSNADGTTPVAVYADPATHRLLVSSTGTSGTVTSVSVASANGFSGTVATPTTTPAITVQTTINAPVLAGNGTAISAATTTGTGATAVLQTSPTLTAPQFANGGFIADANGNEEIIFNTTASAVNEVAVTNAATGTLGALIQASGETNVDLRLSGKGTGKVHTISGSFGDISSYTPNVGSTATLLCQTSNIHNVTFPAGNIVLAVSNAVPGQIFTVRLVQDGGGSRTVTWFSTIKWAGGTQPTLTTTGGKADTFVFLTTSAGNYDGYTAGQNI